MSKIRVGVNGYGVIGRRIADAVTLRDDMELVGVASWRDPKLALDALTREEPSPCSLLQERS